MIPTQTRSGLGSKIRAMFSRGEQGVLFNPNDTSTLFEDAAGTKPAVLEGLVGLMLDQSKGLVLGPELVTNWDFSNGTTGWNGFTTNPNANATINNPGGYLRVTRTGDLAGWAQYELSGLTINKWYTVSVDFLTVNPSSAAISKNTNSVSAADTIVSTGYKTAAGTYNMCFLAPQTTVYVDVGTTASTADFDNISVRELPGNHATSSSTARPTLTRRVNLLSNTEAFDKATWLKATGTSATANTVSTTNGTEITQTVVLVSGVKYTLSTYFNKTSSATVYPMLALNCTSIFGQVILNTNTGVASVRSGIPGATDVLVQNIGGYWRLCFNFVVNTTNCEVKIYPAASTDGTSYTSGLSGSQVLWGADLRPSNIGVNLPAYQRVGDTSVNAADYDTAGFPAWLRCSGGQSMVTPSINFTGTDKMTAWAGVRKLSDVSASILYELSADFNTYPGSLYLAAPLTSGVSGDYGAASRGTATSSAGQAAKSAVLPAPNSAVITATDDISASLSKLRINGSSNGTNGSSSKGTGNFGNYPLYLFARNQASLFFNGLAGPIILRGAQSSASEIANAENWINSQQKVYQPPKLIFTALDSTGVSYPILDASMDSSGSTYTITATVLDSAGTSYNLI